MAYIKNIWVDQDVERPQTYEMTNNTDGSVTLIDSFGLVSELGTPVNADNMNHIENGIESNDARITILEEEKADIDLTNAVPSQSFKNMSVGWAMPDYDNPTEFLANTTYLASQNIFVIGDIANALSNNQYRRSSLNLHIYNELNEEVAYIRNQQADGFNMSGNSTIVSVSGFVPKNYSFKLEEGVVNSGTIYRNYKYYPLKGEEGVN